MKSQRSKCSQKVMRFILGTRAGHISQDADAGGCGGSGGCESPQSTPVRSLKSLLIMMFDAGGGWFRLRVVREHFKSSATSLSLQYVTSNNLLLGGFLRLTLPSPAP